MRPPCWVVTRCDHVCSRQNHLKGNFNVHPHARSEDFNHSSLHISFTSGQSSTAASGSGSKAGTSLSATSTLVMTTCAACSLSLEGAFVRALGNVCHFNYFKCKVSFIWYKKRIADCFEGLQYCYCLYVLSYRWS